LKIIPTNAAEIKSIIHSFKPKYSAGHDKRTSIILKTSATVIIHP